MNQAKVPEVSSWAGITQGTNSVNLQAVLCSTADKNLVYFVKHVLLFRSEAELGEGTVPLCKPAKNKEFCGSF